MCVLILDVQWCISEPGDNEVLADCATVSLQGFRFVCTFVQTGHGLLLFTKPRYVPQTVIITCGGSVSHHCSALTQLLVPATELLLVSPLFSFGLRARPGIIKVTGRAGVTHTCRWHGLFKICFKSLLDCKIVRMLQHQFSLITA